MKKLTYYLGLTIALFFLFACENENQKLENMLTYAKVYGYVKYFHPSDEASQIDWNKFSIYGSSQIEKCKTKEDVIHTLNQLFKPIAPSIKFASKDMAFDLDLNDIIPDSLENYKLCYWQHQGVSIGMDNKNTPYESRRINRDRVQEDKQLFEYKPEFERCIVKEIGQGIYCQIPIALYANDQSTYPRANRNDLEELKEKLNRTKETNAEDLFLRLGNIVNVYNVFQHFYPYFDLVNINWENEFKEAIRRTYLDKTNLDHLISLELLTAPLKDGHISVHNNSIKNDYTPPLSWEWIENKLIITHVFDENQAFKVGDIVTHINSQNSVDYFKDQYLRISAGTEGWLHYRANIKSLQGVQGSSIALTIDGTKIKVKRSISLYQLSQKTNNNKTRYKEIEKGIWYLNLDLIEMDKINKLLPQLEQSESIICDLRGYPKENHVFINHLMAIDDTTKAWMQIPRIIYPDYGETVTYQNHNWISMMKASQPYLGDKKIVFIINGEAISYAESFMGYIEGYKLATIIGQPTAGTNGNINPFSLPGGFKIYWTGMKVLKHDGSQHHGIGILPDIYVEKTIQGIMDGRDEFMEKALEVAKEKNAL